jgi:hypothetical protein
LSRSFVYVGGRRVRGEEERREGWRVRRVGRGGQDGFNVSGGEIEATGEVMPKGGGRGCGFTAARLSWVRQRGGGNGGAGGGSGDVILQRAASVGSRGTQAAARAIGVSAIKCTTAASKVVSSLVVREQRAIQELRRLQGESGKSGRTSR